MDLCSLFASDATKLLVERVLQANTAMLINERFVNIPPQISAPLLQSLKSEIDKARMKNKPFNFDYYLMICKMHRPDEKNNSKLNYYL